MKSILVALFCSIFKITRRDYFCFFRLKAIAVIYLFRESFSSSFVTIYARLDFTLDSSNAKANAKAAQSSGLELGNDGRVNEKTATREF